MKRTWIFLALIAIVVALFTQTALAAEVLNYSLAGHSINIQINPDGSDNVVEKFFISFKDDAAKAQFRDKSTALGTILEEWKKLNPLFTPSLGDKSTNKQISYTEGDQSYLQISYSLTEPLMAKGKEATMLTEYSIKVDYFNSFYQSGLWIIPEKTTISIELPPGAEIRDTIQPDAEIGSDGARKVVTWTGYKSGNQLALNYVLWKKIEPVVDLNAINNFLFKSREGVVLIAIIILILAGIVWQRKSIYTKIEDFVEKHSLIKEE
ncbi:Uncharacterised protein [uncultured archaeon]|nr:Uncharacterised protein [uncultured archaeon]